MSNSRVLFLGLAMEPTHYHYRRLKFRDVMWEQFKGFNLQSRAYNMFPGNCNKVCGMAKYVIPNVLETGKSYSPFKPLLKHDI